MERFHLPEPPGNSTINKQISHPFHFLISPSFSQRRRGLNEFHFASSMSTQSEEEGRKKEKNLWERKVHYESDKNDKINSDVSHDQSSEESHTSVSSQYSSSQNEEEAEKEEKTPKRHRRLLKEESRTQKFISLQKLAEDKLNKIEQNDKGQFYSTVFNYTSSIDELKIRVRILKYPSYSQQKKWGNELLLLEERIFRWQEKVFSKIEMKEMKEKKTKVENSHEEFLLNELKNNPDSIGKFIYSLLNSDDQLIKMEEKSTLRHCAVDHSKRGGPIESTTDLRTFSDGDSNSEEETFNSQETNAFSKGKPQNPETPNISLQSPKEENEEYLKRWVASTDLNSPSRRKSSGSAVKSRRREKSKKGEVEEPPPVLETKLWKELGRKSHQERLKSLREIPQSMYIMASIPHRKKERKEIKICSIKAFEKNRILVLKPSFGYRIIEPKRNHVYRISWELYKKEKGERESAEKTKMEKVGKLEEKIGTFDLCTDQEIKILVVGEIISCEGFQWEPLCVHYILDAPKGWRASAESDIYGRTQTSFRTDDHVAHFSHQLSFTLTTSTKHLKWDDERTCYSPVLYLTIASMQSRTLIGFEGYSYLTIPMTPGFHTLRVEAWKPKAISTVDKFLTYFYQAPPSLTDAQFAFIPDKKHPAQKTRKLNRLGLETQPSGSVKFRLNVIHQGASGLSIGSGRTLDLLDKMSSVSILKSVQNVIDAFHRARSKADKLKTSIKTTNIPNG